MRNAKEERRTKLNRPPKQDVMKRLKLYATQTEAANSYGVSQQAFYVWLKKYGLTAEDTSATGFNLEDAALMRQLYHEGVGYREIAQKFDVTPSVAWTVCRREREDYYIKRRASRMAKTG